MFSKKLHADVKKSTQKIQDVRKEYSTRFKHLRIILENVDTEEAKMFMEANYSHVYHIFYDNFIVAENNLKQKDSVKALMQQMEPIKLALFVACDEIKTGALVIRSLLVTHFRTMGDARTLLKTMAKFEEQGVSEYLSRYRAYTERLTVLIKTVAGLEEITLEKTQSLLQEIAVIQGETPGIYEDLLRLPVEDDRVASKRPPLVRQDSVCVSPRRDPHTGKAVQERNTYALSVWRRVRLKLEGKDPDVARKYSVQEQVDWCINEATSLDNLALLYEGWTPWV